MLVAGDHGDKDIINSLASGDSRVTFECSVTLTFNDLARTRLSPPSRLVLNKSPEVSRTARELNAAFPINNEWKDTIPYSNALTLNESCHSVIEEHDRIVVDASYVRKNLTREILCNEDTVLTMIEDADEGVPSFYFVRGNNGTFKIPTNQTDHLLYHVENETAEEIIDHLYSLGSGIGSGFTGVLDCFPVRDVEVFTVSDDMVTVIKWTEVDSLSEAIASDLVYEVDYYNGLIKFGGTEFTGQLILSSAIDDAVQTIALHPSITNLNLPSRGIVQIDSEYIRYRNRSGDNLLGCERGYAASTAAAHSAFATVSVVRNGYPPETGEGIYVSYSRNAFGITEVEGRREKQISSVFDLNKILVATNRYSILSSIEVTSDLSEYGTDTFGILRAMNNDVPSFLSIRALDNYGEPLSDIEISLETDAIYLDGDALLKTKKTNPSGTARFTIEAVSGDVFVMRYPGVTHDAGNTNFYFNSIPFQTEEDFLLYQIVKDDNCSGSLGQSFGVDSVPNDHTVMLAANTFRNERVVFRALIDSTMWTGAGILQNNKIVVDEDDSDSMDAIAEISARVDEIVLDGEQVSANLLVRIVPADSIAWDSNELNGTMLLLAENNGDSYTPVRPVYYDSSLVIYQGTLTVPDPTAMNRNLGGWAIVGPRAFSAYITATQRSTGTRLTKELTIYSKLADRVSATVEGIDGSLTLIDESFNRTGISPNNYVGINPTAQFRFSMRLS